jgi:N-methylhydantoinase B
MSLDAITMEVYWNRLITVMDETDRALVRTAFSTIVGEGRDFAVILMDRTGTSLAQSVLSSTGFTVMLPRTTRAMLEQFPPETLQDGDVLITNDPWLGTGHLPDVCLVKPVFRRGRLVAYIGCAAHISDIGGSISYFEARDVHEEGLRIPPLKLYQAGEPNGQLMDVIRANVRVPDLVLGDLRAILAAEHVGAERLCEFLEEYDLDDLQPLAEGIQSRSEQAMRRSIAAIPPGTYHHAVTVDGYGEPVTLAATVTVDGEELTVDFAGSSPETRRGAVNCSYNFTLGLTLVALKCVLAPDIPNNEALFGPVRVLAPEGSILNCRFPAPVKGRSVTGVHIDAALYGALAQAIPHQVQAGSGTFWGINAFGFDDNGRAFNAHVIINGGIGASGRKDGLSTTIFPANGSVTPTEAFENHIPLLVTAKELLPGSGGQGQYRGGLGQRLALTPAGDLPVTVSIRPVNLHFPAPGLLGGQPGALGRILLNGQPCYDTVVRLDRGDELICEMAGGGGFGPAERRVPALARRDALLGYVE